MDYKKVLRLRFVNRLSCREIAESCGDCGKTSVNITLGSNSTRVRPHEIPIK